MNTHVVLRPFPGATGDYKAGERVDASGWRTRASLEDRRYIRPLSHKEALEGEELPTVIQPLVFDEPEEPEAAMAATARRGRPRRGNR